MSGNVMIGTNSGSTTQCEGTLSGNSVSLECYYNQTPLCTVVLSH